MTALPEKSLLTPEEVAAFFSVKVRTVYRWAQDDELEHTHTPSGTLRFPREAVEKFAQHTQIP